jgi:hypothetical protein
MTEPDDATSGFGRADLQRTKRIEITFRSKKAEATEVATLVTRIKALVRRRGRRPDGSTVDDIVIEDERSTPAPARRTYADEQRFAKPLDALRARDFARFPIWGFDPSLESSHGLDETAVRPYVLESAPRASDVLFVRARLKTANGVQKAGAVYFRFSRGRPAKVSVSLLEPYRALVHDGRGRIDTCDLPHIKKGHPGAEKFFPLRYDAQFRIGGQEFRLAGTLNLRARSLEYGE